jgi:predicted dehydrogenase
VHPLVSVLVSACILASLGMQAGSGAASPSWATRDLRAGIIGTDTSHVPAFTAFFQSHPEFRIKVVAAYKDGSPDIPLSANRVDGFARTIHDDNGVEIVESIEALLARVDVVLIESVDARAHLAQVTPALKAGKRTFVDKPLAANVADGRQIQQLSADTGTPVFSSSSYRFHPDIARLRDRPDVGRVITVQASSPLNLLPHHPDLYYYGVHGVEALYAVMGTGCISVSRVVTPEADVTTGTWRDGRTGVYYGVSGESKKLPMLRVVGDNGAAEASSSEGYEGLEVAMAEFFHTGRSPVDPAETLEILEFMSAAQLSKDRGGATVLLTDAR